MTGALRANDTLVLDAVFHFPISGVWHADLTIDADDAAPFKGSFTVSDDDVSFECTPVPNGVDAFVGRVRAKVVGGKSGFAKQCEPKFYRAIPASTVLREALAVGGETLASTSTGIDLHLPFWTRPAASVGEAFEECVAWLDATWRVLDDGSVWVGTETWSEVTLPKDGVLLEENPVEKTAVFADAPAIRPGMSYEGRRIGRVELSVTPSETRSVVWFQESDPVRTAFTKIVRQMTRTMDFLAMYPATVVSQNGDGSLELKMKSDRMPSMSRIPIRYGVPGVSAKIKSGSVVAVEFERGDPSSPVATVWNRESVSELTIKADRVVVDALDIEAQKGRPLARVGDMVQVISTAPGTPAIGQILTGNQSNRG